MDAINEKIQKAYMDTIINEKEEALIDRYLQSLDEVERFHEAINEKWAKDVDIKSTGEHEGKSVKQLKKEINALKGKAGNKEKMGELLFALRAKTGWKKGKGAAGLGESLDEATLTRQHFNALADMMKRAKTLNELKSSILDWLKTTNPMFDVERFKKAAGM